MRLLKLRKLLAPIGLAVFALSMNPDASRGQFPGGGGRDSGGKRERGRDMGQGGPMTPGGFGGQQSGRDSGGGRSFGGMGGGQDQSGGRMGRGGFGGMGGGFGGGMDGMFIQLQASYGGSGDTVDYSRVPEATRQQWNLPSSGTATKDQFREAAMQRMQAARNGGGMRPTNPTSADQTTGGYGNNGGYGGNNGGRNSYGSPGGGGAGDASQGLGMLARYDTDKDGRLSVQEAQSSDRLKFVFEQYDANRDGYIDAAEGQTYMADRMAGKVPDPGNPGQSGRDGREQNWGRDQQTWGRDQWGEGRDGRGQIVQEEPKPVVLRYGKLPKDLPSWFKQLDTDEDGQVGLYEWRRDGRQSADFLPMDLNGDGLLTAEEYLRYKNPNFTLASLAPKNDRDSRGDGRGDDRRGGSDDRRSGGDDRRVSGEERRSGGNPFAPGGGTSENTPKEEKKDEKKAERPSWTASLFGGKRDATAANKDASKEVKKDEKRERGGPGGRPGGRTD